MEVEGDGQSWFTMFDTVGLNSGEMVTGNMGSSMRMIIQ